MMPVSSEELPDINDLRKTAVIDAELSSLNVDIAALQETRFADDGSVREKDYTFFWKGKAKEERREHGVGFAVKSSLLPMTEPLLGGTERMLSLRLNTSKSIVKLVAAYASTLSASPNAKDKFHLRSSTEVKLHFYHISTSLYASAGERDRCLKV